MEAARSFPPMPNLSDMIDFLTLEFRSDDSISRIDSEFVIHRAWAIARFGRFVLKPGWWMLESGAEASNQAVEVRLSSAENPLMVMTAENSRGQAGGVRIYLAAAEVFDVSLLVSPWPGRLSFKRLRLRHMTAAETLNLIGNGAKRLLRTDHRIDKLAHVARQLIERRPLGMRTAPLTSGVRSPRYPTLRLRNGGTDTSTRMINDRGLKILLGAEDALHPNAVEFVSREFQRSARTLVVYSDVNEDGVIVPRPGWNAELARWFEVASPPLFFRSGVEYGHPDPRRWPAEAIARSGAASVARIPLPLVNRPKGNWPPLPPIPVPQLGRLPSVSVVIPTKYRIDLLEKCLDGLLNETAYPNLEVVVVDNGSADPRLPVLLAKVSASLPLIQVIDRDYFNFSRLANVGVARSSGEIVLLLNDDIEPIQRGWLHRMVDSAMSPDVGAVGARLLYPDRSIQHAGVTMGIGGVCGHLWRGLPEEDAVRCPYVVYPGERMAVTGACLAVRRDIFEQVGGFDETAFPVSLNDIDFCLRLRSHGLRNVYRGDAVLIHYESQSRGPDSASSQTRRRLAQETEEFLSRWRSVLEDDPFGSPEFDLRTESGAAHYSALYSTPYGAPYSARDKLRDFSDAFRLKENES